MLYSEILEKYCTDILTGKIASCVYTKKAVNRFLNDLKQSQKEEFPFVFIQEEADKLLAFSEELKPADLNGQKLHFLPWQIFCLSNLEGWRYKNDTDRKRFRTAYIEVNRKNGKTTGILLPLVLYNFIKYKSSESYLISSRDDLSEKTFKEVVSIIHSDTTLEEALDPKSLAITFKDKSDGSRLSFFCDGGKSVDGFKPRFFCIDEYHEYLSDKIFDSMSMGMRSKKDAQGVIITTADTDIARPCYEVNQKSKRILNGTQKQEDFFCIIYAIDETDDYHNENTWQKANPSLYDIIDPSVIQSDIENAELTPHKVPELKAKTFGIWGGGSEHSWLPVETWQKNRKINFNPEDFTGEECFGGLDLGHIDDLCAFSLRFKKDRKLFFKHRFYIPEKTVYDRYRKENVNFIQWVENGIITSIPGETIDYDFILKDILNDAEKYKIRGIGYDKWQSRDIIAGIEDKRPDILLIEIEQSLRKLSPLTKSYEKAIKDGFVVDNSPVMLWMINNVMIKPDPNGNYKPLKKSKASTQRIDGVISSIMAHAVAENEFFSDTIEQVDFKTLEAMIT